MMIKMDLNSSELIEEIENKLKLKLKLKLRQKQKEKEEEEEEKEEEEKELSGDTIFHVLAVDDSLIDRKLLEKLLTLSSYQVTCVESGDKALEYLGLLHSNNNNIKADISDCTSCSSASSTCTSSSSSKQELQGSKVNLIMTDYSMPGMSGYDLLKIVKGSSWKDVPVVVMSSENVPSRINMCLEGGAKEFLLKPLKLSDLKKLQSQLLVSSSHSHDDDDEEKIKTPNNFVDEINNNNIINKESAINISSNKRKKAVSTEISELRPKLVQDIVVS